MDGNKQISNDEYNMLCTKAFKFDKFCDIMEDADSEYMEGTMLKLYNLYTNYLIRRIRKEEV